MTFADLSAPRFENLMEPARGGEDQTIQLVLVMNAHEHSDDLAVPRYDDGPFVAFVQKRGELRFDVRKLTRAHRNI